MISIPMHNNACVQSSLFAVKYLADTVDMLARTIDNKRILGRLIEYDCAVSLPNVCEPHAHHRQIAERASFIEIPAKRSMSLGRVSSSSESQSARWKPNLAEFKFSKLPLTVKSDPFLHSQPGICNGGDRRTPESSVTPDIHSTMPSSFASRTCPKLGMSVSSVGMT